MLEKIPGLKTAFFSIMESGRRLKPQRGPRKAILTWHLAMLVPDRPADCQIVIDGEPRAWQLGRSPILDDTYEHEVWNRTQQEQVVLLMHIRRPTRFPGSWVAHALPWASRPSPLVQDARRNQEIWERRFEQQLDQQVARSAGGSIPSSNL